jgi:uncharacterized membrane protein
MKTINIIIIAMLWSLSPAGESKVGIPYAIYNDINIYIAFLVCFLANLIVYPFLMLFLDSSNRYFFRFKPYKKMAVYIARKAKNGAGKGVEKYGFWGLMVFVAVPLPGTGIWAGTIAAYIFKIDRKKAFYANALGIFLSALIIWIITVTAYIASGNSI